jgi:hypothetical protein
METMTPEIKLKGFIIPRKKVNRLYMKCVRVYNAAIALECLTSGKPLKEKVRVGDLMKVTRKRDVVTPRQWAMYFLKVYTKMSLAEIGNLLSGKDHATVLHAVKTVITLYESNKSYKAQVDEIEKYVVELCKNNRPKIHKKQAIPINFNDPDAEQLKRIADDRLLKIRMLEQTIYEQTSRIQSLVSELRISENQTRLFKRKFEYTKIPARILQGE